MIGSTISHFRVTAKLGEGGMGEVWRAEDTKLGREVAVKVLPDSLVDDADRLARFEREARVLASLDHPNIAGVYEVGHAAPEGGADDIRPIHFLVMQLAPGETLAERIERGPVAPEQALPIAIQLAEGIEAAHERGIVHRDLKPANIKIDAEGRVRILDFGLARALDPEPGSAEAESLANSPTMTLGATVAGMLLGTAAYMSPEQAAGRPADKRADIWAFGVVLFELLTGRRLFEGETVSHVLAAVLKDEPAWDHLPSDLSPRLRRLLERCLRRDPKQRLQAIGDARVMLQEIEADPEADSPSAIGGEPATTATAAGTRAPWVIAAAASLAALGLLGAWLAGRRDPGPAEPMRFEIAAPQGTGLALNHQHAILALSRDGRRQLFLTNRSTDEQRLALRDLSTLTSRILPGTEGATSPIFSPDGEWLAFFARNKLWRMPVAGGPPSPVADAPGDNRGATWGPDGYIYASPDSDVPLQRVLATGGSFEPVAVLDPERLERTHRWPHALPDGVVLFTSDTMDTTEFYDDARIEAIRPDTGERKVVVEQSSRAWFLPPGHLLFARGGAIFAAPFDAEALEVTGSPVVVLQGVSTTVASGVAHLEVSETGSVLYLAGEAAGAAADLVWVDREGNAEPIGSLSVDTAGQISLSPDGTRTVIARAEAQGIGLWVADLARGAVSRLTFEETAEDPVWSPDGNWLYYSTVSGLQRRRSDGSSDAELILAAESRIYPCSLTPDGSRLLVEYRSDRGDSDLGIVTVEAPEAPVPFAASPADELMAEISPDGRWAAFVSFESGRPEIYVRPFPEGPGRWQISTDAGLEPRWSRAGDEIYYRSGVGTLYAVPVDGSRGFVPGPQEQLFGGLTGGGNAATYSVSPDGDRFLSRGLSLGQTFDRLALVLGWRSEVEHLTSDR